MICTLLWLTVSAPFVFRSLQHYEDARQAESRDFPGKSKPAAPFQTTSEEKTESGVSSLTEEYLHDACPVPACTFPEESNGFFHSEESIYLAFHGELLSPPPDPAS